MSWFYILYKEIIKYKHEVVAYQNIDGEIKNMSSPEKFNQ